MLGDVAHARLQAVHGLHAVPGAGLHLGGELAGLVGLFAALPGGVAELLAARGDLRDLLGVVGRLAGQLVLAGVELLAAGFDLVGGLARLLQGLQQVLLQAGHGRQRRAAGVAERGGEIAVAGAGGEGGDPQAVAEHAAQFLTEVGEDRRLCDHRAGVHQQAVQQRLGRGMQAVFAEVVEAQQAARLQQGEQQVMEGDGAGAGEDHPPVGIEDQHRQQDEHAEVRFDQAVAQLDQQCRAAHQQDRHGRGAEQAARIQPADQPGRHAEQQGDEGGEQPALAAGADDHAEQQGGQRRQPGQAVDAGAVGLEGVWGASRALVRNGRHRGLSFPVQDFHIVQVLCDL